MNHPPTAPAATLTLNDQPRDLRLDFNALVRFEEATQRSALTSPIRFCLTDLRALTWAMLEPGTATLNEVGLWLADADESVSAKIFEMAGFAFPEADGESGDVVDPTKAADLAG